MRYPPGFIQAAFVRIALITLPLALVAKFGPNFLAGSPVLDLFTMLRWPVLAGVLVLLVVQTAARARWHRQQMAAGTHPYQERQRRAQQLRESRGV